MLENSTLQIRLDYSYQLSTASITRPEGNQQYSIIIEKDQPKDFLKTLQLQAKKRHHSSKSANRFGRLSNNNSRRITLSHKNTGQTNYQNKLQLPRQIISVIYGNYKYPDLSHTQLLDRMYGAFFGFLIGDSVGSYLAFYTSKIDQLAVQSLLMTGGGSYNLNPGQGTDDTQLAFSLADGLIQGNGKYNPDIVAKYYALWIQSKPFDIAALVSIALNGVKKKIMKRQAVERDVLGLSTQLRNSAKKNINQQSNIGLIRLLPLAIWSINLKEEQIQKLIKIQMQLLSPNPLVLQTALLWVRVLHTIFFKGDHQEAYYNAAKKVYEDGSQNLRELWDYVECSNIIPSKGNLGRLKTSFSYAFIQLQKPRINFVQSLLQVLRKGGDTDSNAAIVCSLVGAVVGYSGIPPFYKYKIMNAQVNSGGKPRPQYFKPNRVVELVKDLVRLAPQTMVIG